MFIFNIDQNDYSAPVYAANSLEDAIEFANANHSAFAPGHSDQTARRRYTDLSIGIAAGNAGWVPARYVDWAKAEKVAVFINASRRDCGVAPHRNVSVER